MNEVAPLDIVVMAGGSGTRFWPASRTSRPKQLIPLVGGSSMLVRTIERILPLQPASITIVTHRLQLEETIRQLTPFKEQVLLEYIAEPVGRNTAAAIAVAAARITYRNPDAVMVVLPADHYIRDAHGLQQALLAAAQVARDGSLVTLGIVPTCPETGYGYIRATGTADISGSLTVDRFVEKPDRATAMSYLESGDYVWNSGMFVWQVRAILQELHMQMPELAGVVSGYPVHDLSLLHLAMEASYEGLVSRSIDHGVMERAAQVRVIPISVGWSDMGSWSSIPELIPADEQGNHIDHAAACVAIDSHDCIVSGGDAAVALIGVQNLIVVQTGDALLVCERGRAQDVKLVVEGLQKMGKSEYTA